jgi:hypothetical protein
VDGSAHSSSTKAALALRWVQRTTEGVDTSFHVHVGKELSGRGQESAPPERAGTMHEALSNASLFRFQYQENPFTCGQQAAGKFWKASRCAEMVMDYPRKHGIAYGLFFLMRPDWAPSRPSINKTMAFTHSWCR